MKIGHRPGVCECPVLEFTPLDFAALKFQHRGQAQFQGAAGRQKGAQIDLQSQIEACGMPLHVEGQGFEGRIRMELAAVALQLVDIPIAARGQVELPVGLLIGHRKKGLQAGVVPEAIAARSAGGRGRQEDESAGITEAIVEPQPIIATVYLHRQTQTIRRGSGRRRGRGGPRGRGQEGDERNVHAPGDGPPVGADRAGSTLMAIGL